MELSQMLVDAVLNSDLDAIERICTLDPGVVLTTAEAGYPILNYSIQIGALEAFSKMLSFAVDDPEEFDTGLVVGMLFEAFGTEDKKTIRAVVAAMQEEDLPATEALCVCGFEAVST